MLKNAPITLGDRVLTAAVSAMIALLIALCGPMALFILLRGHGIAILEYYFTLRVWGSALIVIAWTVGFALGEERMQALCMHLWGTARPQRLELTALIWAVILAIVISSVWFSEIL